MAQRTIAVVRMVIMLEHTTCTSWKGGVVKAISKHCKCLTRASLPISKDSLVKTLQHIGHTVLYETIHILLFGILVIHNVVWALYGVGQIWNLYAFALYSHKLILQYRKVKIHFSVYRQRLLLPVPCSSRVWLWRLLWSSPASLSEELLIIIIQEWFPPRSRCSSSSQSWTTCSCPSLSIWSPPFPSDP